MSTKLLQYVAECFQGKFEGMHCLGAVSGSDSASPSGVGSRGGVMSVVRALGVLVCEGRLQGPPRGYKEGPHCAAPLQASPNDHVCEKDNYLCGRYLVLVREIGDRITIGSSLSVEVLMCTDCPCGHARATCKPPVSIASSSISQWQHPSDILLEYWSIGVVPSKSPEMMNSQGLYQAVRSRLHFSQVAAWWSRSNGTRPSYVTTRIVTHSDDNIRKFRETPIEHTFPLAGIGDGNSIKVTVWALPRMEEVPTLNCSLHPSKEKDDECAARALTPTKNGPMPSSTTHTAETLALPVLVDDRLRTACDKPGKHHCHCEDEEAGSPPSPSIRPNGERKRRRSLPCGPHPEASSASTINTSPQPPISATTVLLPSLASVIETPSQGSIINEEILSSRTTSYTRSCYILDEKNNSTSRNYRHDLSENLAKRTTATSSLERCFRKQVSLSDDDNNDEKRYKPSNEPVTQKKSKNNNNNNNDNNDDHDNDDNDEKMTNPDEIIFKNNPGPSYDWLHENLMKKNLTTVSAISGSSIINEQCTVHKNYPRINDKTRVKLDNEKSTILSPNGKELSSLMSKMSFPYENSNVETLEKKIITGKKGEIVKNDVKGKNCNLELSQREFNEVLAVLRSRTPTSSSTSSSSTLSSSSSSSSSSSIPTLSNSTINRQRRSPTTSKISRRRVTIDKIHQEDTKIFTKARNNESSPCPIHFDRKNFENIEKKSCDCKIFTKYHRNTNNNVKDDVIKNKCDEEKINNIEKSKNNADVLLGAILRASSREDDYFSSSSSNFTRNKEINDEKIEKKNNYDKNDDNDDDDDIIDDEKKITEKISLNKRLSRFRQLFQMRELERGKIFTNDGNDEKKKNLSRNRRDGIKRKIDFNEISRNNGKMENLKNFWDEKSSVTHKRTDEKFENDFGKITNSMILERSIIDENSSKLMLDERLGNNIFDDDTDDETKEKGVPSAIEQIKFRRSFENAASMVFHSRTGLPLTSSPAPLRRGHCCFDYDSTLNTVSSKRSALFELNTPPSPGAVSLEETDREIEISADGDETPKRQSTSRARPQSHALLGSFEESALNGRLEPVSTVHGFTAELGASGSFCPKHRKLPVTVFFYTLGDNDKVSTPYLAHINLGKKGYQVPRSGTIQVTLLNPLGTVVKMFVVLYDLSDMPPRSHTFLRQRTLRDKTLRYLVHLRFMSGKSGRIYLHTDIRMIICRKSDVDTASDFGSEPPKELRSYIHGPTNPKFSPRC